MTRDETKKLIMIIAATYPNYKPDNASAVIDAWHLQLMDEDYQSVQDALVFYNRSNTSGFAPSIGQLLDCAYNMTHHDMTEMEAWALVRNRISSSIYYSKGNWETLPDELKTIVSAEQLRSWAMDEDFNEGVAQSNFCRSYRAAMQRKKDMATLPESIRARIEAVSQKLIGES